jgi:hypothetical protein
VLVATEVDPLFLLLPLLEANGGRFSPLHQYLSGGAGGGDCGALRRVARLRGALERTCELREGMGSDEDDVLVRLDRERALRCLAGKARRLGAALQAEADAARARARAAMAGAFHVGTTAAEAVGGAVAAAAVAAAAVVGGEAGAAAAPPATEAAALQPAHAAAALSILSDYLSDAWLCAVAKELGCVRIIPRLARAPPTLTPPTTRTHTHTFPACPPPRAARPRPPPLPLPSPRAPP